MKSRTEHDAGATRRLNRGITATWWYTVTAVAFLEGMIVVVWAVTLLEAGSAGGVVLGVSIGGLVWVLSTLPLLFGYRVRSDADALLASPRALVPVIIAVVYGAVAVALTGSWLIGLLPLAQSLMLLNWPRGVRVRVVLAVTILLGCTWFIDARTAFAEGGRLADATSWILLGFYSALLPAMTVASLWWWDVLATLDLARASEARLAATQERLRVATDVHDLQGHHLQVIALHLELTEKLMTRDPAGALATLRTARTSVDEARQGTRDLAMRFRAVPLSDEIANARDLLIAAGIATESAVTPDSHDAPAGDFGPVIRETTTNVLRHGGGKRARLSLDRVGGFWRYEISNDVAPVGAAVGGAAVGGAAVGLAGVGGAGVGGAGVGGAGLDGIDRRVSEAGGRLEVVRGAEEFTVIVTIPVREERAR